MAPTNTVSAVAAFTVVWVPAALGVVGHTAYQYFFIGGLARTSVANSSLMLAATPVLISVIVLSVPGAIGAAAARLIL